jgi:prevent-host-death family protein
MGYRSAPAVNPGLRNGALWERVSEAYFGQVDRIESRGRAADRRMPPPGKAMSETVNLYEAKTHLSRLVDRAAQGEEIVIAKMGKPKAKLVPFREAAARREPTNLLGITFIAADFDEP